MSIDQELLQVSVVIITDKLRRIRETLVSRVEQGHLHPDFQYAVRIVESRIREMQRIYYIKTRPEGDSIRDRALQELSLKTRDKGELRRWGLKNHSIGRLDCPGCEYTYGTLLSNGPLASHKTILSLVCVHCGVGVMHSRIVESNDEAAQAIDVWENQPLGTAEVAGIDVEALLYACEACTAYQLRSL